MTIKTLLFALFLYICLVWVGAFYWYSGPDIEAFGLLEGVEREGGEHNPGHNVASTSDKRRQASGVPGKPNRSRELSC